MSSVPPTLLLVLDGWGLRETRDGNAVALARTPVWDQLLASCPHTRLEASGEDVGLPVGLMGNSNVGHMNLGCGRIVHQDIQRISRAIADGSIADNRAISDLLTALAQRGAALHLMGLTSDGGVHSHDSHLLALVQLAKARGVDDVRIHAFLDGRDTPPRSALEHLGRLADGLVRIGSGRIVTVCGRYWAMDRDRRWERIARAYRAIVDGVGETAVDWQSAVRSGYGAGTDDEFVVPTVIDDGVGASRLEDGDGVLFFNFRADRARQMTEALTADDFSAFERRRVPRVDYVMMTRYDASFDLPVAFAPEVHAGIFADVLAAQGLANLRVAETEKYAHVTYFFNGGIERPWPGEERALVPSPKVSTYDRKPEMSAAEVTAQIVTAFAGGRDRVVIANFANADMVGHTGDLAATVRAIETLDECFGRIVAAADRDGWDLWITADHGNAEQMLDPATGQPHTAHTTNPVPLVARVAGFDGQLRDGGRLADVVPTILEHWQVSQPEQMTGVSLLR